MSHIASASVLPYSWGSDHSPIALHLEFPVHGLPAEPCRGAPLAKVTWNPLYKRRYVDALQSSFDSCVHDCSVAIDRGDVEAAFQTLHDTIMDAAALAGMLVKHGAQSPRQATVQHKPFFDHECIELKRQVRRQARCGGRHTQEYRTLERQYHSLVRSKRRRFLVARLKNTLSERRDNPRSFWKRLRFEVRPLPLSLSRVQVWDEYLHKVAVHPHIRPVTLPLESHPIRPTPLPSDLEDPVSEEEVLAGLRRLNNGRAPGFHGCPSELLRAAQPDRIPGEAPKPHVLAPLITRVAGLAFRTGMYPKTFNQNLVTPVFKKGDAEDISNYRPIAVGEPITRLYAHILGDRLVSYTEKHDFRAPTQAGFRPRLSTIHNLFTLQHFIDKATAAQPLYCCFLDLKGAYDTVPRDALWEALGRIGVHGQMLAALQSLYKDSQVRMKVQGRTGINLPSQTGLKQGCPLSPTLFGIFVDGLFYYLATHCQDLGGQLGNAFRIRILGYADDFVLISDTAAGLQRLIDCAYQWCSLVGMILSFPKTKVMIFKAQGLPSPPLFVPAMSWSVLRVTSI